MNLSDQGTSPTEISYLNDRLSLRRRIVRRSAIKQPEDISTRLIPLTKGQVAIVDAWLYEWLMQWNWHAVWNRKTRSYYVFRYGSKSLKESHSISMHRQILGLKQGDRREGDHQNHDTLDNRGRNLRIVTKHENAINHRLQQNNKSGYRGVSWCKSHNNWVATISKNGKLIQVGRFNDRIEAAKARDAFAIALHGPLAILNFP